MKRPYLFLLIGIGIVSLAVEAVAAPSYPAISDGRGCQSGVGDLWAQYAEREGLNRSGSSGGFFAPNMIQRARGTIRIAAIPIQFQQDSVTTTTGTGRFNLDGHGTDTAVGDSIEILLNRADTYYRAVSYGLLKLSYTVFDSYLVTQSQTMDGYSASQTNLKSMVREALMRVDTYVNFGAYDIVVVFHAGAGLQLTGLSRDIPSQFITDLATYTDVQTGDTVTHAILSAAFGRVVNSDTVTMLGNFCHEFGHAVGLVDLHNTLTGTGGVGNWSLMGTGSYLGKPLGDSPAWMDAWSREYLGWADTKVIDTTQIVACLRRAEDDSTIYKIRAKSNVDTEYFLLEVRAPKANDIDSASADGLLIWHVDNSMGSISSNNVNSPPTVAHRRVDLEEADSSDIGNSQSGDSGDPWPGGLGRRGFGNNSFPNSRGYYDTIARFSLKNIAFGSGCVSFKADFSDISAFDTFGVPFTFVRKGASNPPPQSAFGAVSDLPVLQLVIAPKSNGTLTSVKVTTSGSGNDATGLSAVKIWQDGDGNGTGDTQLGSTGSVATDNGTVTFSNLTAPLTKDNPFYLAVTYTFSGAATAGQTFIAQIASSSDITLSVDTQSFKVDGLPQTGEAITVVSSSNTNPSAPTPSSPADGATGFAPNGEITISGYSDANGDTHKCTHWQTADSTAMFDNLHMRVNVVISAETAGFRFKFPRGLIRGGQRHYWRGRFCDARGGWSSWSTTRNFVTAADTFAITPTANKTLDSNPFVKDTRPIGFKLKNGGDERFTTLGAVKPEDEVTETGLKQKPSTNFKFGLFTFSCENVTIGGTVTISLAMPESVPTSAKYVIFDPAAGWLDVTENLTSHDGDSEVFLTLTDGGVGDLDGAANGVIVDPGGFEISDGSSSSSAGGVKYPSSCVVGDYFRSRRLLGFLRIVRDISLRTSLGRKLTRAYYR